jgi:hypothetical protein
VSLSFLRIFSPEFYFADFFTLFQGFSFVMVKSNTYVPNELFCGLKLTNLGEFSLFDLLRGFAGLSIVRLLAGEVSRGP